MSTTTTVVHQGLQSCLEPIVLEPRVLTQKLSPSKQASPEKNGQNPTWNFLETLTNTSHKPKKLTDNREEVYVHPLSKRSSCSLSSKSLEMCTESLGSETGNGIDSYDGELSYHAFGKQSSSPIKIPTKTREIRKKVKHSSSFPPPLTSISGNDGVQVQTHREGGRLVIKAFNYSSCNTYLQTERENGRLRLSLVRDGEKEVEEKEKANVDESEEKCENDKDEDFRGKFWGEKSVKEDGGKIGLWSIKRCNGDRSKTLPSLPFCVAIS